MHGVWLAKKNRTHEIIFLSKMGPPSWLAEIRDVGAVLRFLSPSKMVKDKSETNRAWMLLESGLVMHQQSPAIRSKQLSILRVGWIWLDFTARYID